MTWRYASGMNRTLPLVFLVLLAGWGSVIAQRSPAADIAVYFFPKGGIIAAIVRELNAARPEIRVLYQFICRIFLRPDVEV